MKKLATLASLAVMTAAVPAVAEDMTIVSWGGAYSDAQLKALHQPYMDLHPEINILRDDSSAEAVAKLRAMAEAGNTTWDLVDVVAADALRVCDEGLAMELDVDSFLPPAADGTPASEDFGDFLVNDCFVPNVAYSTTIGYRTDLVGDTPPSSICDIFDLEKYPGKRALEKRPINNMEWALMCDGVPKDKIYDVLETEEGQDQALAKLDTIKDQVIWYTAFADTPQLLADGEIVMGSTFNGRLFSVAEEKGQPVAVMWDAEVLDFEGWIIPAGLSEERKARAMDYLAKAASPEWMAAQASYIPYSPARKSANAFVGKHAELGIDMAPHMPTNKENAKNSFIYNFEWWADYRDDLDTKFQAWLSQS